VSSHEYTATRRDIDTNNHVNNVKYLEWVFCHVPDDIFLGYRPIVLKVAYKKETKLGDKLGITIFRKNINHEEAEIFALIEKSGVTATEIYTRWRKNE